MLTWGGEKSKILPEINSDCKKSHQWPSCRKRLPFCGIIRTVMLRHARLLPSTVATDTFVIRRAILAIRPVANFIFLFSGAWTVVRLPTLSLRTFAPLTCTRRFFFSRHNKTPRSTTLMGRNINHNVSKWMACCWRYYSECDQLFQMNGPSVKIQSR